MKPFKAVIKIPLNDTRGFTLMELMIIIAIISLLGAIAIFNYMPSRARAMDSAAMSDARNIVDSVINATMNSEDVDFTKFNTGGPVGDKDTAGNPRTPVFVLSPGVAAVITGDSIQMPNGNTTIFSATIYHTGGTSDPTTLSGKKEYVCTVDENTGIITVPGI